MIKLLKDWIWGFLFDPKVAAASLRSFLTFLAATGAIITASASDAVGGINADIIKAWDWKAWAIRIGFAILAAGAVRIRAGDKNPVPVKP